MSGHEVSGEGGQGRVGVRGGGGGGAGHAVPRGGGLRRLLGRQLSLRGETLQVGHEAESEWVLNVEALHSDQVPRNLCCALPEPDVVVVHRELGGVVREGVHS